MSRPRPSRRTFLKAAGLAAGSVTLAHWTSGTASAQTPLVRRNIKSLDRNGPEIAKLRQAFRVIEARTQSNPQDPTGWLAQANIHRDRCSHGNWWFFPWHRGYLYHFEQILRAAANDPTLTIPYWDWSDPDTRDIPVPYWWPYLYRVARGPGITWQSPVPDEYVDPDAVISPILDVGDFGTFGGNPSSSPMENAGAGWLEGSPHNNVHSWIGGAMGVVGWAAEDPIFWCHHANVDRLWSEWVTRHGQSALPTDSAWLGQRFSFYGVNGQPASIAVSQVLTTTGLNYTYEPAATAPAAPHLLAAAAPPAAGAGAPGTGGANPPGHRVEALTTTQAIGPRPVTVTVSPPAPVQQHISNIAAAHLQNAPHGSIRLSIEGMQIPDFPNNPQVLVRVFLNLPTADAATSFKDIHYAGNFSFFPSKERDAMAHGPATQLIDVTRTVARLAAANQFKQGDPLTVTLVARPIAEGREGAAITVPFRKIALTVIP